MIQIDMPIPEKCGLCPCFHPDNPMYCQAVKADKNKKIVSPYGSPRPKWCPMKEHEAVEPKRIVRKQCKTEHSDGSVDYYAEWFCPHCNSLILRGFDNPSIKFCYKCGKPILWEGR